MSQQGLWDGFFRDHYLGDARAERIWASTGIETRHGVVDPRVEDVSSWGTADRMRRFVTEAMPLGKDAVGGAIAAAGLAAEDIGLFGVASCTGYATPGVDILLARDLGMRDDVQRLHIGHMGCYAAIPALGAVADFVTARSRPAVLLCVELTSLHVQPARADVQQVVAHSLFSDAAAAVVVEPGAGVGLEVVDMVAITDPSTADLMTWDVTDLGFAMGLSPKVPDVLATHVQAFVARLLEPQGLTVADVTGWAVHPGGRRILEVVEEQLALPADALESSYSTLRDFGNCSSATVLLVLESVRQQLVPGDWCVAMAFGPGLTLYATLLRAAS
jgi:predicted naringenin-chalcone synthase